MTTITAPAPSKKQVMDYNFSEIDTTKFRNESATVAQNIQAAKKAGITKFKDGRVTHLGNPNLMFNPLTGVYTHKSSKIVKNILHKIR
jgi:DUF1365 family protein